VRVSWTERLTGTPRAWMLVWMRAIRSETVADRRDAARQTQ
jgi:hypothetical protein